MPRNYLKVPAEVKAAHRIQWFAVNPSAPYDHPEHFIPRNRFMRGRDWGWDVRCSCGWKTSTGGAIEARIREEVEEHRWHVHSGARYQCKDCGAESPVGIGYVLRPGGEPERSEPARWCRNPHLQGRLDSSKETC